MKSLLVVGLADQRFASVPADPPYLLDPPYVCGKYLWRER
jgi:hypothetical protein